MFSTTWKFDYLYILCCHGSFHSRVTLLKGQKSLYQCAYFTNVITLTSITNILILKAILFKLGWLLKLLSQQLDCGKLLCYSVIGDKLKLRHPKTASKSFAFLCFLPLQDANDRHWWILLTNVAVRLLINVGPKEKN